VYAHERAQRRGEVRRRAGDAEVLCALRRQREVVGTAAYRDADADPRFFLIEERAVGALEGRVSIQ
jgi:hypothetical protein